MDSWQSGTHPLAILWKVCHIKSMKNQPDLTAIMADYTAQVIAEERRRQAIRDAAAADEQAWFAKWEATRPQGQWGRWHISDRD